MSVEAKTDAVAVAPELVTVTIDGIEVSVPKGTLAIRAAETIGIAIPRFCDHPLLDPMGACRQCLVEVPDMGNGRGMPKPQASCTLEVAPGMKISTQRTSPVAEKAQRGMIEFLLINHPLDCPICDKGGECPLQNQALSTGDGESRYHGVKRTFPKPVSLSAQILLDRERCILCARCTRFSEQISGDPFIALVERGALQQVGSYVDDPYDSYFSGNVVQICPVGALTSAAYRFQARPFDLVSTPTTCEHCASGCQLRADHRHFQVKRRLAGDAPEVNEEWNCDRGRFGFVSARGHDRLIRPLVRQDGVLRPASWPEAIDAAVAGLKAAGTSVGVLTGGRLTAENAYGYAKFARAVLGTNHIDFRSRPHTTEEAGFLAARVAGRRLGQGVTYTDLENAKQVVLVGLEPEEESPIVFLRLRKAVRKRGLKVFVLAAYPTNGSEKLSATWIPCVPGTEAAVLDNLDIGEIDAGTVLLVGERAALAQGTLSVAANLADATGAKLGWVPRRAGDRGAIEAGCLPNLLPGGRLVADAGARVDMAAAWGIESVPPTPGLDADAQLGAAASGELQALVVAGIDPCDFRSEAAVLEGLENAGFVVSLEQRTSPVTERADVVFPVALIEDQAGTFLNFEHRHGPVGRVITQNTTVMTDLRVLAALADAMGHDLGFRTPRAAGDELAELGVWDGPRAPLPESATTPYALPREGELVLASWRLLIDDARGIDGEIALRKTGHDGRVRLSPATAERLGLVEGQDVHVSGPAGAITFPLAITWPMADDVVWVPACTGGTSLGHDLGAVAGDGVVVSAAIGGQA